MQLKDAPLSREDIIKVIEGKGQARRIPMSVHSWIHAATFGDQAQQYQELLDAYPNDIEMLTFHIPKVFDAPADDPSYRWLNFDNPFSADMALDAISAVESWDALDDILANFPDPNYPGLIPTAPPPDGRYRVGLWWYWLFERLWSVRGMENALCDFLEDGESIHKLFRALTDFYKVMLTRGRNELGLDAVCTSDDIGAQTSTFFSQQVFRDYFKPYYKELIDHAHALGMHFWMHSCGNIKSFIPELVEIGLDVLHPIQKYTMDEREIAAQFGDDICIWAGMDVQQTIPYLQPEDVRREVRFMIDTYYRDSGRLIITAGNNMTVDTPYDNLLAFLDETLDYGARKCR